MVPEFDSCAVPQEGRIWALGGEGIAGVKAIGGHERLGFRAARGIQVALDGLVESLSFLFFLKASSGSHRAMNVPTSAATKSRSNAKSTSCSADGMVACGKRCLANADGVIAPAKIPRRNGSQQMRSDEARNPTAPASFFRMAHGI